MPVHAVPVGEEKCAIGVDERQLDFTIILTRPCVFVNEDAMKATCSAAGLNTSVVIQLLTSLEYGRVKRNNHRPLPVTIGNVTFNLANGTEFYLDARAAVRKSRSTELT